MEEQITNLLEGNFDYENGSLDFSCTKLELTLYRDEKEEGSFRVYGPKGRLTKGKVFSSEPRMQCLTKDFVGEEEEILYIFDGTGLEEGDVLKLQELIPAQHFTEPPPRYNEASLIKTMVE